MKLLILGHGRHGKDTVAEILNRRYGLSFTCSSDAGLTKIFPALKYIKGYETEEQAKADKFNNRLLWKELICLLNAFDKTALLKHILSMSDIYVGMRCKFEYEETIKQKLVDRVIWVDASSRSPVDPSLTIDFDPSTMYYLDNNGDKEELEKNVSNMIEFFVSRGNGDIGLKNS